MRHSSYLTFGLVVFCFSFAAVAQVVENPQAASWATRTINGSVARPGAPVANVCITIESSTGSFRRIVYSDSSGNFALMGVPAGEYTFFLEAEGYLARSESVLVTPGTGTLLLQFVMRPAPVSAAPSSVQPAISVASLQIPERAYAEFQVGERALKRQRWQEARKYFEKAVNKYPDFPQALRLLAILDLGEKHTEQALTRLRRAVEIDPAFTEGHLTLSRALSLTNQCQEAAQAAGRAIELRPDWWLGHYELGVAALCLNHDTQAWEASERILSLGGRQIAELHLLRAGVFLKRGQLIEAKAELLGFLEAAPKHEQAGVAQRTVEEINKELLRLH